MPILKTITPETIQNSAIVSQPSGNCPYYLVKVDEVPESLQADIIEDTAEFFKGYDLNSGSHNDNQE
jgi:hypothetical protein